MDLVTRHQQDIRLLRKPWQVVYVFVLLVGFLLLPAVASDYTLYIVTFVLVYSIGALGQNLLIGYAGQISLGQVGFLAVGAYAFAHAAKTGIPFFPSLLLAGSAGAVAGVIVGIPSLRLKGPYLAIATLGFGIAAAQALTNWEWISGGRMGLVVPKAELLGFDLGGTTATYYLYGAISAVFILATYNLTRSFVGRAFIALRDSDVAAEVLGVHLTRYKVLAFAVSSFYTAVHGALWGQLLAYLEPQMFTFIESVTLLAAVIIGGIGTVAGSIFGAAFVVLVPQLLSDYREGVPILFGVLIVLVMLLEPLGLYGRWIKTKLYFQNFPFR